MFKAFALFIFLLTIPAIAGPQDDIAKFNAAYAEYQNHINNTGDIDSAIEAAEKVYKLAPEVYGKKSEEYAILIYNLAELYDLIGNPVKVEEEKKAVKLYREYFKVLDQIDTPLTQAYLDAYYTLTVAAHNTYGGSVNSRYEKKLLDIADKMNMSDAQKGDVNFNIAMLKFNSYVGYEAADFLKTAHKLYLSSHGKDSIRVADTLFWMAKIYTAQRDFETAHQIYAEVLRIFELNFPNGEGMDASVQELMIILLESLERSEEATKFVLNSAIDHSEAKQKFKTLYTAPLDAPEKTEGYNFVKLDFNVNKEGRPIKIKVNESSDDSYNEFGISSLAKFRFTPIKKDGDFIESETMQYTLSYLTDNRSLLPDDYKSERRNGLPANYMVPYLGKIGVN